MRAIKIIGATLIALAVAVLVFLNAGDFRWRMPWRWLGQGVKGEPGSGEVGPVVHLNPFLVTEWEEDRERQVTVTFDVEVNDDLGRQAVTAYNSRIRSEILSMLADSRLTDVGDAADLQALKAKVQDRIQHVVPEHAVRRVFITQFLIY